MRIILDTNVYSDYAEGTPEAVDIIARKASEICFPAIVLGELYYGFGKSTRKKLNDMKIEQFINLSFLRNDAAWVIAIISACAVGSLRRII